MNIGLVMKEHFLGIVCTIYTLINPHAKWQKKNENGGTSSLNSGHAFASTAEPVTVCDMPMP
jgi:hypothetical protein